MAKLDKYERLVKRLFMDRFALELRKIPEEATSTPDFEVFASADRAAVLEVKGIESTLTDVSVSEVSRCEDDLVPGVLFNDNGASRVAAKIHAAVKQFRAGDGPRVLALVNADDNVDRYDLKEAIDGYLRLGEYGEAVSSQTPGARARMAADRRKIHVGGVLRGGPARTPPGH